MGEQSKIEWTDHTFNPWTGCTKVSPACDHCYAEGWAKRSGHVEWGPHADRRRTSFTYWAQPLKWDRQAKAKGRRARVFCASLADVFDNHRSILPEWRADLWALIAATPQLDWLLLTKRPQNIATMLPGGWGNGWPNVWLGTTVEDQKEADRRIPHLLAAPAPVRFLSCEPLLGPVDLTSIPFHEGDPRHRRDALSGQALLYVDGIDGHPDMMIRTQMAQPMTRIDWVICGGESGPGARPMHPEWARSLRNQCQAAGVAFFFKQWGDYAPHPSPMADGVVYRVGKARAGRLLDGREWNDFPQASG